MTLAAELPNAKPQTPIANYQLHGEGRCEHEAARALPSFMYTPTVPLVDVGKEGRMVHGVT